MFEFVTWLFINPAFFVTSIVDLKVLNCTKYKIRLELFSPCNKSQGPVASCERLQSLVAGTNFSPCD